MSLLYSRIFGCFITVNTLFFLFSFTAVKSAFKMASIQVLFNSIGLYVTTLTDPLAWTDIELYQTINLMIHQVFQSACNIQFIE